MRKNFGTQTWLYPMPVLIIGTYDENGVPDAMNAAWGGIHDTGQIGVCIDPGHKTAENLLQTLIGTDKPLELFTDDETEDYTLSVTAAMDSNEGLELPEYAEQAEDKWIMTAANMEDQE